VIEVGGTSRNVPEPVATDHTAVARQNAAHTDERIRALEAALRAAEDRAAQAERVFESITDGVMIFDQTGRVIRMNAVASRLFAFQTDAWNAPDTLDERPLRAPVYDEHGRVLARDQLPFVRILRGEELHGSRAMDVIYRPQPGRDLQVNISGAPIRDEQGQIVAAICLLRDVTERRRLDRRTEDALDALLAMAEVLVQAPAEETPTIVTPAGGPQMDATAARLAELTRRVLGCERLGIVTVDLGTGRQSPVAVVGIAAEQLPQWWAEMAQTPFADIPEFPFIARLRAGQVVMLDLTKPPFSEPPYSQLPNPYNVRTALIAPLRVGERLIGTLSYDYGPVAHTYSAQEVELAGAVAKLAALVLERERLLRERAAAQADVLALRESNRRMDEFVGIVSHELRTPLTTVVANIQIAQRWVPRLLDGLHRENSSLDPAALAGLATGQTGQTGQPAQTNVETLVAQLARLLERSDRQAARLARIVGDLLDMSRIQAGRLELLPERCNLIAIVQEAVEEQRAAHPARTITLTLPAGTTDLAILADPDRAGQVVTNYLSNALKYAPTDRPIEVRVERKGTHARVSVHDEGPGLTKGEQDQVWGRFYRVDRIAAESGSGVGLGLGLYISRTIVERLGGKVGVQSARGKGTTFWWTLPLAE
jgi:PAS domain S-box-containing protein